MPYEYHKLAELQPETRSNFYGKIVFMQKTPKKILMLLKDETACMYVWIKPPHNKVDMRKVNFRLRQVIRIHRCYIHSVKEGSKIGIAKIGEYGCHLVSWTPHGNVDVPKIRSSKKWTRSRTDEERFKFLSELGKNPQVKTTKEQLGDRVWQLFMDEVLKILVKGSTAEAKIKMRRRSANAPAPESLEKPVENPLAIVVKTEQ